MENLCINCKKIPIVIKKRGLCKNCYQNLWYKKSLKKTETDKPVNNWNIFYNAEVEFIKNFFNHKNWFYHPVIFRVNGFRYEPDFYDNERNVFIEVAGTRQAFHANLHKYKKFLETFPHIKFEVRQISGELIDLNADKFHIDKIF